MTPRGRPANGHNARPFVKKNAMRRALLTLALLIARPGISWAEAHVPDAGPMPAEAVLDGLSQKEWAHRWWQWAFSFDEARSPVADRSGAFCASRQTGAVWFLAGTYGSARTQRSCRVPQGKYLFFPVINYISARGEGSSTPCEALVSRAARLTEGPATLVLEVDGRRFDASRIHRLADTRCFSVVPGSPPDAASNGYFVMLPPLPAGPHVVEFLGMLPGMTQAVTYRLQVE